MADTAAPAVLTSTTKLEAAGFSHICRALSSGSPEEVMATVAGYDALFRKIDDDDSGSIDISELGKHLDDLSACGVFIPPFGAIALMKDFDLDDSGTISLHEFRAAMCYMCNTSKEAAEAEDFRFELFKEMRKKSALLFAAMDTDNDGTLELTELMRHEALMKKWGMELPRGVKALYIEMDLDGDGEISPLEFELAFAAAHAWTSEELGKAKAKAYHLGGSTKTAHSEVAEAETVLKAGGGTEDDDDTTTKELAEMKETDKATDGSTKIFWFIALLLLIVAMNFLVARRARDQATGTTAVGATEL